MTQRVSDPASNRNEHIENAAKAIGRSEQKRKVFEAIHHGKKARKAVAEIAQMTNLTEKQVLNVAKPLVKKEVFEQERDKGTTYYKKNSFLQEHKREVLNLAGNANKLAKYPTKRNMVSTVSKKTIERVVASVNVNRITIDDIKSFSKVRDLPSPSQDRLPSKLKEDEFRKGVQQIIGEPGEFKDWGGEKNDLYSGRLIIDKRRRSVAFAFKGPGVKTQLRPKNMGTNGDQAQRLFESPADVFLVQHWREIDESVVTLIERLAIARSLQTGKTVWYGVIDGKDSRRIYEAYPEAFSN